MLDIMKYPLAPHYDFSKKNYFLFKGSAQVLYLSGYTHPKQPREIKNANKIKAWVLRS